MDKLNLSLDEIKAKKREEAKAARAVKAPQQQPKSGGGEKKSAANNNNGKQQQAAGGGGARRGPGATAPAAIAQRSSQPKGLAAPPLHTGTPVIVSQLNARKCREPALRGGKVELTPIAKTSIKRI